MFQFLLYSCPRYSFNLGTSANYNNAPLPCQQYDELRSTTIKITLPRGYVCNIDETDEWRSHHLFQVDRDDNRDNVDYIPAALDPKTGGFWCAGHNNECVYFLHKYQSLYPRNTIYIPLSIMNPSDPMLRSDYVTGVNVWNVTMRESYLPYEVTQCVYDPHVE